MLIRTKCKTRQEEIKIQKNTVFFETHGQALRETASKDTEQEIFDVESDNEERNHEWTRPGRQSSLGGCADLMYQALPRRRSPLKNQVAKISR